MPDFFKQFENLVELAQTLEERIEKGELRTDIRVNARPLSNIPTGGSIPRSRPVSAPSPDPEPPSLSLELVGGLGSAIAELKELVALPLKRPDLLQQMGLEPPRGVLLVGPPGTGKTLTARALAAELDASYIAIAGSEVMGKYYGEAEGKLRQIFEKASQNAPCLIFIDEIDSIAPDRRLVEGEVEKRVVAQLLSLMDGFARQAGVVVLAATNYPDRLDPALRRPGRFDREVRFGVPDRLGRREILYVLTREMPLAATVNLDAIADAAVGFVGADLKALTQAAAYRALRRSISLAGSEIEVLSDTDAMQVTAEDFGEALQLVKPSILRSVEVETPQVCWEEIGGLEEIKQTLQEAVEGVLSYPELYQRAGARAPRGILLWGVPGTGKTLLAKAIATQARANFISVSGADLMSRWVGASEQAIRELFAKARQVAPCVIFCDEIDAIAPIRGQNSGDSGVSDRVVAQLLTELDGLTPAGKILLVAATNRYEAIDPAVLRSGRLELHLHVDLPDANGRLAILNVCNRERPLAGVDVRAWADLTAGWSGADLALLSDRAALEAVKRARRQGIAEPTSLHVTAEDFAIAYQSLARQFQRH